MIYFEQKRKETENLGEKGKRKTSTVKPFLRENCQVPVGKARHPDFPSGRGNVWKKSEKEER